MFASNGLYAGTRVVAWSAFQWQPTRTSHDPDAPITIDHAAAPVIDAIPILLMAPMLPPRR